MTSQTAFIVYDVYHTTDREVSLDVVVGNGQAGSTLLKLGTTTIGDFTNSFNQVIGKSQELVGKSLTMFTTIQDIQPDTDKVNLDIALAGGRNPHEQSIINATVPSPGDIASALVTIRFI